MNITITKTGGDPCVLLGRAQHLTDKPSLATGHRVLLWSFYRNGRIRVLARFLRP
jgi:hypothetical protein